MEPSLANVPNQFLAENFFNVSDAVNDSYIPENVSPHLARDPLAVVIPISVIYSLIFVSGVIGNVSTCIVIGRTKTMHTATNYYLFSLAISDFVLLVSSVPMEIWYIWNKFHPYVFGEVFCVVRGILAEASANATVLTVLTFTVERYVAICHPFLSHTLSKLSRAIKLIVLVWIISFAYAIPQALQFGIVVVMGTEQCVMKKVIIQHSFELSTFLFFFFPMSVISVLYILIGLKLRASTRMKRDGSVQKRCYHSQSHSTRRVIKMLVCVVVAFFLCWAPFHAQRLIYIYGIQANTGQPFNVVVVQLFEIMTYVSGILYYLSTCINPLLYNIMSHKFREAFKETLACICNIADKKHCEERSYRILSRQQRGLHGISSSKQESSEYSGNSYRDGSVYVSNIPKPSFEAIAMCYSSNRSLNRDRYVSKVVNLSEFESYQGTYPLCDFGSAKATDKHDVYTTNMSATTSQINIFTEQGREIFLNILPTSSPSGNHARPDIKINIDIPKMTQSTSTSTGPYAGSFSVIYNKQGTVQISVAHDESHFKLKHLKRTGSSSLLRFIRFKRKKYGGNSRATLNDSPMIGGMESVQQMLDDDLIKPTEAMCRNRLRISSSHESRVTRRRRRLSVKEDADDGESATSLTQESELDAYMRELRTRTIDVG